LAAERQELNMMTNGVIRRVEGEATIIT